MRALGWIQHQTRKMEKLNKNHWLKAKQDNINLMLQSEMQIIMCKRMLIMIDEEIAKFPEEKKVVPEAAK